MGNTQVYGISRWSFSKTARTVPYVACLISSVSCKLTFAVVVFTVCRYYLANFACFLFFLKIEDRPDANLTTKEVFDYFMFNYKRYNKTRTPFGIYQHVYWFLDSQAVLEGFLQFLDYLATFDYVYIVPVSKV